MIIASTPEFARHPGWRCCRGAPGTAGRSTQHRPADHDGGRFDDDHPQYLLRSSPHPDLVITDVRMPPQTSPTKACGRRSSCAVAAGGTVVDPEVVRQLISSRRDPLHRLSPRERDVLALMAEGQSNTTIARTLVVSEAAVAKHIGSLLAKLDLPPAGTPTAIDGFWPCWPTCAADLASA